MVKGKCPQEDSPKSSRSGSKEKNLPRNAATRGCECTDGLWTDAGRTSAGRRGHDGGGGRESERALRHKQDRGFQASICSR